MPETAVLPMTIGEIARRIGVAVHVADYIIRTRGIRPVGRAGQLRLFDSSALLAVARELRARYQPSAEAGATR